jgi:hypothetical protein
MTASRQCHWLPTKEYEMRVTHPVLRPILCLSLAAALGGAGVAQAAKKPVVKPVCNLLTDAPDDADGTFIAEGVMPSSGTRSTSSAATSPRTRSSSPPCCG